MAVQLEIAGDDNTVVGEPANKKIRIKIKGHANRVEFGENFKTGKLVIDIEGDGGLVFIGDDCRLAGTLKIRGGGKIVIGSETTFQDAYLLAGEGRRITVGRDCMFSSGVMLRTTDAHSIIDLGTGKRKNLPADIEIGDHVWLGMRSTIARGGRVADHCIVGTGAIVTKQFDVPNCTLGGIPAKVISEGVTWVRDQLKE